MGNSMVTLKNLSPIGGAVVHRANPSLKCTVWRNGKLILHICMILSKSAAWILQHLKCFSKIRQMSQASKMYFRKNPMATMST